MAVDPWRELYDYRCLLAVHVLPELLDPERIWHDTANDIARLQQAIRQAMQSE